MVCTNKDYAFIFEEQSIYFLIKIQFFKCFDNLSNCQNIKKKTGKLKFFNCLVISMIYIFDVAIIRL